MKEKLKGNFTRVAVACRSQVAVKFVVPSEIGFDYALERVRRNSLGL